MCLAYVADEVSVGDYAIVHVGFAISRVDEEEARRTYEILEEMSELDELEWMKEVAREAAAVDAPGSLPPQQGGRDRARGVDARDHVREGHAGGRCGRSAEGRRTRSSDRASTTCSKPRWR